MKEAMVERLVEAVKGIAGEGYEVKSTVVKKNNGVELDAVNIRKAGENVVPTIYIQRELELLEADKITVHEAAKHVLGVYEENKSSKPVTDVDIKDISGRDFILQHVEYQLVNAERNAERLETYLHNIRNIEEIPPGPVELDALDAAVEAMKAAVENVEYGAFAWDKQRGVFVPIGRPVLAKQLCLNRYQERVRKGEIPSWIDPEKFKILERTVAEIASDWKEANDE